MDTRERLVRLLADGRRHTGPDLAAELGVSRAAVWKQIGALSELGLTVDAQTGAGYQLPDSLELLRADLIQQAIAPAARAGLGELSVAWSIDSTNNQLLAEMPAETNSSRVCLAEFQTGGRGRHGKQWRGGLGAGVYLSVDRVFPAPPADFGCLSLAVGVAVRRALMASGAADVELKWPNDLVHAGSKLGGILVDVRGDSAGPLHTVVGVGINALTPKLTADELGEGALAPTGMEVFPSFTGRNKLAANLVSELVGLLAAYADTGFSPLLAEWREADFLRDRALRVTQGREIVEGVGAGIDGNGNLLLRVAGAERKIAAGTVALT